MAPSIHPRVVVSHLYKTGKFCKYCAYYRRRSIMKTCFLFPGQGAQYPGMAQDFFETSKACRDLFALASEASRHRPEEAPLRGQRGGAQADPQHPDRRRPRRSAAAALAPVSTGVKPEGCAGFSVGEWPALAEAGVVSYEDMFRLVAERGRLMDEAGRRSGGSTMSAVLSPRARGDRGRDS